MADAVVGVHEMESNAMSVPMIAGCAHPVAAAIKGLRGQRAHHRQRREGRKSNQKFSHFHAPKMIGSQEPPFVRRAYTKPAAAGSDGIYPLQGRRLPFPRQDAGADS
jgi:hypothetical protein